MSHAVRRALVIIVAAAVALGLGMTFASTASPPAITFVSPSPAEGATLTTNSVEFKFTYNKRPKAMRAWRDTPEDPWKRGPR